MDYGKLLNRAWEIIWGHKFLILLGILVILGGGGSSNVNFNHSGSRDVQYQQPDGDISELPFSGIPGLDEISLPKVSMVVVILLVGVSIIVGLCLWVLSTVARGGLIIGVNDIVVSGVSGFSQAFSAGLTRIWPLLGISILPAIPAMVLGVGGLLTGGLLAGLLRLSEQPLNGAMLGVMGVFGFLACLMSPILLFLNFLRALANRACMLENLGVFAAYGRGFEVLKANLGEAALLFVLQIAISVAVGLLMVLPGVLMALCCVLWPVLFIFQGAIEAYFSTLWTLAWREWTLPAQGLAR